MTVQFIFIFFSIHNGSIMLAGVTIAHGGVLPNINLVLLPKKNDRVSKGKILFGSRWVKYNIRFIDMTRFDLLGKFKIKISYKSSIVMSLKWTVCFAY